MLAKFESYLIRKYYDGFVDVCGNDRVMNGNGLYMPGFSFVIGWEALKDSAQKYLFFAFIWWALNIYRKQGGSSGQTGVKETTKGFRLLEPAPEMLGTCWWRWPRPWNQNMRTLVKTSEVAKKNYLESWICLQTMTGRKKTSGISSESAETSNIYDLDYWNEPSFWKTLRRALFPTSFSITPSEPVLGGFHGVSKRWSSSWVSHHTVRHLKSSCNIVQDNFNSTWCGQQLIHKKLFAMHLNLRTVELSLLFTLIHLQGVKIKTQEFPIFSHPLLEGCCKSHL